jgi:hypothetical protein
MQQRINPPPNVKLSRRKGIKPKVSQLEFGQMAWNVADGTLYAKILNAQGEEEIITIAGNGFSGNIESKLTEELKIQVFDTLDELEQYLMSPARYAGQMVLCKEAEGKIFVLSNDKSQWLLAAGNEQNHDKHFKFHVTHTLEEIIEHNLGKKPAVQILGQDNAKCIADVEHINENQTKISWLDYFTGTIIFN